MVELSRYFPPGVKYDIPYDSSKFIKISISQVVETLVEAVILVFLVMYLFLQNLRYTLIPTIVVPVSLLGAFAAMNVFGYSINVLTMFAMVLAVGILVDDAIVVIENVERIMSEEGLSPREATKKAMGQITAALIGISVTLVSVFLPMAFFSGSVGNIYRQFSLVMVSAMLFSVFLALSLTPALCATFLKPVEAGHKQEKGGFFGWFNRGFKATTHGYENWVAKILRRTGRFLVIFGLIVALVVFMFMRMPSSFLPTEDQGYLIANVQLPPGATQARTLAVMQQAEGFFLSQPEVDKMVSVLGFSFSGSGQNAALAFVPLKPWDERKGAEHSAQTLAGRAFGALAGVRDAFIFALVPPAIPELGTATGFSFRLQDRGGNGHAALLAARNQLLGMAAQSKVLAGVRPDGLEDAPQLLHRHRPRPRQRARRLVRQHQRRAVDLARLGLRQRLPERRPAAARHRPGRRARPHAARRPAAAQRRQQPGQAGADGGAGDDALDHRADPDHPLQRLPDDADLGRRRAGLLDRRRDERDGAPRRPAARRLRLRVDRPVARGAPVGRDGADPARVLDARRLPLPVGALRELVDPVRGAARGAARRARRGARRDAARHAQRRLLQGRPDHRDRPVGEERDPDHRVREGPGRRRART